LRDEHLYYRSIMDRLEQTGKSIPAPDHDTLLAYLFLCYASALKNDRAGAKIQEPAWSDPATTFSIVMNNAGAVTHDYCCSCIEALGGTWERECGPVTNACLKSTVERNEVKNNFLSRLKRAQQKLKNLKGKTPQEYYFLKTSPVIREVASTASNHFVVILVEIQNAIDLLSVDEAFQPWADYERIRDYYTISLTDTGTGEIRIVFYRIRKQKMFVRYLQNLGLEVPQ